MSATFPMDASSGPDRSETSGSEVIDASRVSSAFFELPGAGAGTGIGAGEGAGTGMGLGDEGGSFFATSEAASEASRANSSRMLELSTRPLEREGMRRAKAN